MNDLTRHHGNNIFVQNEIGTRIAQSKFAKISNRLSQEPFYFRFQLRPKSCLFQSSD